VKGGFVDFSGKSSQVFYSYGGFNHQHTEHFSGLVKIVLKPLVQGFLELMGSGFCPGIRLVLMRKIKTLG
jgi:hypothetical protein